MNWIRWTESTQMKLDSLLARQDVLIEKMEMVGRYELCTFAVVCTTVLLLVVLSVKMK